MSSDPMDVHVHVRSTDSFTRDERATCLRVMSPEERSRAARFALDHHRSTFIAAHGWLRTTLSRYEDVRTADWIVVADTRGKPRLGDAHAATGIRFNLAHTEGLIACAVCRQCDVGIDVESLDRHGASLDLARRYFSAREVRDLEACGAAARDMRFIELWTLKEAYVKATGAGLAHPLDTVSFEFRGDRSLTFDRPSGDRSTWQFALYAPTPRHRLAIAIHLQPHEPARCITYHAESGAAAVLLRLSDVETPLTVR